MKARLRTHGVVANPRHSYGCGFRLALSPNPLLSFCVETFRVTVLAPPVCLDHALDLVAFYVARGKLELCVFRKRQNFHPLASGNILPVVDRRLYVTELSGKLTRGRKYWKLHRGDGQGESRSRCARSPSAFFGL